MHAAVMTTMSDERLMGGKSMRPFYSVCGQMSKEPISPELIFIE
jgi:hypothetical protein